LFANAFLDRDVIGPPKGPGPRTKIQVTCIVWDEKTGLQHTQTNILSIDILDEDDNPLTVQGNTSIIVQYQGFKEVTLQYQEVSQCKIQPTMQINVCYDYFSSFKDQITS